jgi:hypothetical protein
MLGNNRVEPAKKLIGQLESVNLEMRIATEQYLQAEPLFIEK